MDKSGKPSFNPGLVMPVCMDFLTYPGISRTTRINMILCTVHRYGVLCFNELVAYSKPTHRSTLCMIMIVHSPDVAFLLLSPRVIYAAAFTYQLNECPALLICSKATIC